MGCALSNAGKTAIDGASAGALNVGIFKIGSLAGANVINGDSTNVAGTLSHTGLAADIKWASFGANKLNLYIRLFGTTEITIGNIILYLADGVTPLAYITFDQRMVKRANTANSAQDAIVFIVSLRRSGISDKFSIPVEQSRNFDLPVYATRQEFEASRDTVGMIASLPEASDLPVLAWKDEELLINAGFEKTDAGEVFVPFIFGGEVGDHYITPQYDWKMEWL